MLKQCWMFGYVQEFICDLLTLGLSSDVPVSTKHSAWVFLKSSCCAAMCWACCGSPAGLQADAQLLLRCSGWPFDGGVSGQAGFELDSTSEQQRDAAVGLLDF